jgi:hypothetical protein
MTQSEAKDLFPGPYQVGPRVNLLLLLYHMIIPSSGVYDQAAASYPRYSRASAVDDNIGIWSDSDDSGNATSAVDDNIGVWSDSGDSGNATSKGMKDS